MIHRGILPGKTLESGSSSLAVSFLYEKSIKLVNNFWTHDIKIKQLDYERLMELTLNTENEIALCRSSHVLQIPRIDKEYARRCHIFDSLITAQEIEYENKTSYLKTILGETNDMLMVPRSSIKDMNKRGLFGNLVASFLNPDTMKYLFKEVKNLFGSYTHHKIVKANDRHTLQNHRDLFVTWKTHLNNVHSNRPKALKPGSLSTPNQSYMDRLNNLDMYFVDRLLKGIVIRLEHLDSLIDLALDRRRAVESLNNHVLPRAIISKQMLEQIIYQINQALAKSVPKFYLSQIDTGFYFSSRLTTYFLDKSTNELYLRIFFPLSIYPHTFDIYKINHLDTAPLLISDETTFRVANLPNKLLVSSIDNTHMLIQEEINTLRFDERFAMINQPLSIGIRDCTMALFRQRYDLVPELCDVRIEKRRGFHDANLHQVYLGTYLIYNKKNTILTYKCKDTEGQIVVSGMQILIVPCGCRIDLNGCAMLPRSKHCYINDLSNIPQVKYYVDFPSANILSVLGNLDRGLLDFEKMYNSRSDLPAGKHEIFRNKNGPSAGVDVSLAYILQKLEDDNNFLPIDFNESLNFHVLTKYGIVSSTVISFMVSVLLVIFVIWKGVLCGRSGVINNDSVSGDERVSGEEAVSGSAGAVPELVL